MPAPRDPRPPQPFPTPTRAQLAAAVDLTVPDVVSTGLRVLFCGINPGLYTAYTGLHFARPGNRFWPTLHRSGFTPRQLAPWDQHELLSLGLGITNLVPRASATAAELSRAELVSGRQRLERLVAANRPDWLAVLGVTAFRGAFEQPKATLGPQARTVARAPVWVLPNPSGLNAHYTPARLAEVFAEFREATLTEPG